MGDWTRTMLECVTDPAKDDMDMVKYAVPRDMAERLLELGLCDSAEDAMEKVAAGLAEGMIKQAENKENESGG